MNDKDHTTAGDQSLADVALGLRAAAKERNTLSPADSARYRAAVRALRLVEGRQRSWIAALLETTPGNITRLIGKVNTEVSA